jgi:hypothetical protein
MRVLSVREVDQVSGGGFFDALEQILRDYLADL